MEREHKELNGFTCLDPEQGKLLPEYMDGKLEGRELSVFEAHLSLCDRCSEKYLLRRETETLLTDHWEEIAPRPSAPANILFRWRVPALVPAALAAVILLLLIPWKAGDTPDQRAWRPIGSVEHLHLAGQSRSAGESSTVKTVHPGDLLEITLDRIPAEGEPIRLVIGGVEGPAGDRGLPFEIVKGYPLLNLLIPELSPGSYPAEIVSGPEGTMIHRFSLVIEER